MSCSNFPRFPGSQALVPPVPGFPLSSEMVRVPVLEVVCSSVGLWLLSLLQTTSSPQFRCCRGLHDLSAFPRLPSPCPGFHCGGEWFESFSLSFSFVCSLVIVAATANDVLGRTKLRFPDVEPKALLMLGLNFRSVSNSGSGDSLPIRDLGSRSLRCGSWRLNIRSQFSIPNSRS